MIEVGDTAPLEFIVVNPQLSRADATVTLTVNQPDGTTVSLPVIRAEVGVYTALYVPAMPGRHTIRWSATGTVSRSSVDVLNVIPSTDSAAIISLAEAREHLNITDEDTVEDEELRRFIEAASGAVERHTGQVVARRLLTERFMVSAGSSLVLRPPVLRIVSAVDAAGATLDVSSWVVDGFTGFVSAGVSGAVTVTYEAGMPVVPAAYIMATQIICAHLWETQRVQNIGTSPGFGQETNFTPSIGMGYALPNRALELLGGKAPNIP